MRGLTISQPPDIGPWQGARFSAFLSLAVAAPRNVRKDSLTHVPLRDLALEQQYDEIRKDLERYREPITASPQDGETQCNRCGAIQPDEIPRCDCGTFLHFHRVFTCPGCSNLVPRDARDCGRCGSAFWSPVNPPQSEVTDSMVQEYLNGLERLDEA